MFVYLLGVCLVMDLVGLIVSDFLGVVILFVVCFGVLLELFVSGLDFVCV